MKSFDVDVNVHIRLYDVEAEDKEAAVYTALDDGTYEVFGITELHVLSEEEIID